jgi:predicted secreted protein
MGWVTGIAVYVVVWFISLFTVLPIGARRAENPQPGTVESAPDDPRLKLKFSLATGIAAVLWLILYALVTSDVLSFHDMARSLAGPDS